MRRAWLWVGLATVAVAVALVAGRPPSDGPPLDPSSTGPLGTRALVLLLEELGADVEVTDRPSTQDVAVVLADDLDHAGRESLGAWVEAGGTLVIADPDSPLNPFPVAGQAAIGPLEGDLVDRSCGIDALAGVERVDPSGGVTYSVGTGVGCFTSAGGAFVAAQARGRGAVAAIGGAGALVNRSIGEADNAALAAALAVPRPGVRVAFLRPPAPGSGRQGLVALIAPDVKAAGVQLGVAFLVYALWQARRLGRPVVERLPASLTASELVVAVGNLLHHARRHDQAANLLRDDLRRALAHRLGLAPDSPPDVVAEAAGHRSAIPTERIAELLRPSPVAGTEDLVALAGRLETMRQEVLHAR